MLAGMFASRSAASASVPTYSATPYALPVNRAGRGAAAAGATSVNVTEGVDWVSTDYIVFGVTVSSVSSITASGGLTNLGSYTHPTNAALTVVLFGGFKGSNTSWTFSWSGAQLGLVAGFAYSNIDTTTPFESATFSAETTQCTTTRDIIPPTVTVSSTTGKYEAAGFVSDALVTPDWVPVVGLTPPVTSGTATASTGTGTDRRLSFRIGTPAEEITAIRPLQHRANTPTYAIGFTTVLNRAAGTRPAPSPNFASIETYLSSFSQGWAWAAQLNGTIVDSDSGGWARNPAEAVNPSQAFTIDTVFTIASVSKLITELAIRKLAADGAFALTDTADSILPGTYSFSAGMSTVTINQLLTCHTGNEATFNLTGSYPSVVQTWVSQTATDVGQKYFYNNGAAGVLHAVIEQVTGTSYESWVQANIFTPLGVTDATDAIDTSMSRYYGNNNPAVAGASPVDVPTTGAGGWCMSIRSLLKIAGALRSNALLDSSARTAMLNARGRCISAFTARGEYHWHDGVLSTGSGQSIACVLMRMSDGYDVAAVTNTERSPNDLFTTVRDSLVNTA